MSIEISSSDNNILSRLKEYRKINKLSQTDFANKIGIRQSTYNAIETGKSPLSEPLKIAILSQYQINKEWLLEGIGEMQARDQRPQWEAIPREQVEQKNVILHVELQELWGDCKTEEDKNRLLNEVLQLRAKLKKEGRP